MAPPVTAGSVAFTRPTFTLRLCRPTVSAMRSFWQLDTIPCSESCVRIVSLGSMSSGAMMLGVTLAGDLCRSAVSRPCPHAFAPVSSPGALAGAAPAAIGPTISACTPRTAASLNTQVKAVASASAVGWPSWLCRCPSAKSLEALDVRWSCVRRSRLVMLKTDNVPCGASHCSIRPSSEGRA